LSILMLPFFFPLIELKMTCPEDVCLVTDSLHL
jgi:hypothetical protein